MKRRLITLVFFATWAGGGATAGTAAGPAKIDSVVVFPDRARITWVATARCEKATARAVFEPLPEPLAALTLRVKESFDPRRILNPGRMYAGI